jgi:hypothetical protein
MARGEPAVPAYDRFYYAHYFGSEATEEYKRNDRWLAFFALIAERIVFDIGPRTVLDAGCAMGFLVEALRDRKVEAYGIDVSDYALEQVRDDIRPYCSKASVTEPFASRYDLIVCIETLEHLSPEDGERAAANIGAHTDDLIFSSTPTHFKEPTHLNVRPPEYWAELFARYGLFHDVDYQPSSYIAPWAMRFRRRSDPPSRIAGDYERLLWRLRNENISLRELSIEQQGDLARAEQNMHHIEEQLRQTQSQLETARADFQAASMELHKGLLHRLIDGLLPRGSRRRGLARSIRMRLRSGVSSESPT